MAPAGPACRPIKRNIETLFGHIKGEWPELEQITDPAVLHRERVRLPHWRGQQTDD